MISPNPSKIESRGAGTFSKKFKKYRMDLYQSISKIPDEPVQALAEELLDCWHKKRQVFIFGNGGSAGNAIHVANDWLYGISKELGNAIRVNALPANSSVLTCLANDIGYEDVFSAQLSVLGKPNDLAIALSGSGNSPNIASALKCCKENKIRTYAILGFSGGSALELADVPIHTPVNDMQISEDIQLIICHAIMQWLFENKI
tara:strand:+ start:438 stop:1046 length:609 start_codon:yes stop_codon:yes gene_type:complete